MNPFPLGDPDRRAIWEILVEREIEAVVQVDWESIAGDYAAEQFVGYAGNANPDHWRIAYPTLASYREGWLRQAQRWGALRLREGSVSDWLHQATVLRDIELSGDLAMAHKKFDGRAATEAGAPMELSRQTIYWLRRFSDGWKITGLLGSLPHPMPSAAEPSPAAITLPAGASQHVTAGPYSPALRISGGAMVAISGQGPIDMAGKICGETIEEQAELTFANCRKQLESAGAGFADVFKVMVYLSDMQEWEAFNQVYRRHFSPPYPVRTAIEVGLWGGMKVEIDMLAVAR